MLRIRIQAENAYFIYILPLDNFLSCGKNLKIAKKCLSHEHFGSFEVVSKNVGNLFIPDFFLNFDRKILRSFRIRPKNQNNADPKHFLRSKVCSTRTVKK